MKAHKPSYPPDLLAAFARGDAGDGSALPQIQAAFDHYPELVDQLGNLQRNAEERILRLLAGTSVTAQEAARRSLDQLRQDLLANATSPLERLLVERVVLAHAWVGFGDLDLASRLARESGSSPACRAAAKRLDQAQRRFLAAVKALVLVQKLLPRSVSAIQLLANPVTEGPGEMPSTIKRRLTGHLAGTNS